MITILLQKILVALTQLLGDIKTKLNTIKDNLDDLIVVATASGPIASFTTTITKPFISCKVDIKPKQASGTPTPSNPLPISGTDTVVVTQTDGDNQVITTKTVSLPSTVYDGEVDVIGGSGESNKQKVTIGSGTSVTVANSTYIKSDACDGYITNANIYPNNIWVTAQADQVCNKLTMAKNTIWNLIGYPNTFAISNTQIHLNISNDELGITDYTQETTTSVKEKIEAWLANNPIELTIPVEPTQITLANPIELTAISGVNNVFGDTDGNTSVEYLKLYKED